MNNTTHDDTPATNADQTSVMADAQETERITAATAPQQPSIFPMQATQGMHQGGTGTSAAPSASPMMHHTGTGVPTGPTPPVAAMPMPDGSPAAPMHIREHLSNKMIGLVVGVSLACGLAAGVAGTAITNAINGHGDPGHSRIGAPYASSELEETPDFEQMPDMQQGGETGRSRSRRMPMQQQGPQDQQDENSSDSNSKSGESDSGKSSTESSDWLMEFFEIA
ncbi:hypothetical protein PG2093B_0178 [Bifidobacterium pseudolongum subsp. globosum]|uniref:Ethanolamine utilization protein EutL n=1 Tax=Bifidobacterium pseudolongum subsp. globosum TaxID=1690 RepID=A0A4Q5A294_9BIFI|nr:hypothetical protein [Bifidobacterium pseudolongum]RYQ12072.1 hypothetical protein PG2093B_0178 [Bifidobacterium pseudolongum subsp. globosum]